MFHMGLSSLSSMMAGMLMMSPSRVGMVGSLGVVSSLMSLRSLSMVTTRMLMMLGSLVMMLCSFFRHLMAPQLIALTSDLLYSQYNDASRRLRWMKESELAKARLAASLKPKALLQPGE